MPPQTSLLTVTTAAETATAVPTATAAAAMVAATEVAAAAAAALGGPSSCLSALAHPSHPRAVVGRSCVISDTVDADHALVAITGGPPVAGVF